jgi:hypothetical protein
MRRLPLLCLAFLLAGAMAPAALAGEEATVTPVELGAARSLAERGEQRFTLAGIHWRGPGRVAFRTRSLDGTWSGWRPAAPEEGDQPNAGTPEAARRTGWRIGNPWWVGPSDRIETRTSGRVTRIRAYLVWSAPRPVSTRTLATADAPPIVLRSGWGANESIRRGPPVYAPAVRFAVVHHTAGRNDYTRAEAPAVVKAIQLYHVQGNRWNDIGYNFLVDRFGTIYEGRYGGVDRNVVGAHALGFNTGSVGVAVLGTYTRSAPSQAAQDAVTGLLAWRLDLAHVDPTGIVPYVSGGSERFPLGTPTLLAAVSGHRDTGRTACPGDAFHGRLPGLAKAARALGLPKIFEPRVDAGEADVRFRARLSSAIAWTVTVTGADGLEVARGAGTGTAVDWTWDAAAAVPGTYRWAIRAGTARAATGTIRAGSSAAPLAIQAAAVEPQVVTPNGDGQADSGVLAYALSAPANVTVSIADAAGTTVATVVDRVWTRAGRHVLTIDATALPDGSYTAIVVARSPAGAEVQRHVPFTVSRTLGLVSVSPSLFSPNGDGRLDTLAVTFVLTAPADVRVRIVREGRWVASPATGSFLPGTHGVVWDGRRSTGALRDGAYEAVVEAADGVTVASYAVPFVSDTTPPRVRILPGRPLRVEVSEPALLVLRIDGAVRTREVRKAGIVRIPWPGAARRVRVVARDAAGNTSAPVVRVAPPGQ